MISGFFQLQLNGTKAKKKETKEKKTQRIEMKKEKEKVDCSRWDSNQHLTRPQLSRIRVPQTSRPPYPIHNVCGVNNSLDTLCVGIGGREV